MFSSINILKIIHTPKDNRINSFNNMLNSLTLSPNSHKNKISNSKWTSYHLKRGIDSGSSSNSKCKDRWICSNTKDKNMKILLEKVIISIPQNIINKDMLSTPLNIFKLFREKPTCGRKDFSMSMKNLKHSAKNMKDSTKKEHSWESSFFLWIARNSGWL